MDKMINVYKVLACGACYETVIENTLKSLQEEVGGYIEIPHISRELSKRKIDIIINEEGKLIDLQPSIVLVNEGKIADIIFGGAIFASADSNGNTIGLNEEQMNFIRTKMQKNKCELQYGDTKYALPFLEV